MIINKKTVTAAVLLSIINTANAGFFDSWFAKEEPVKEVKSEQIMPKTVEVASATQTATNMATGLLPVLVQKLGVTEEQAGGGMGALMQVAKGQLSTDDFSQLSTGVPNMSSLLAAAPALTGKTGGMTDMLASAGGVASSLGGIAALTEQFKALGLSSDMIGQFANIAISYFSQSGNTGALLQQGLGSILN